MHVHQLKQIHASWLSQQQALECSLQHTQAVAKAQQSLSSEHAGVEHKLSEEERRVCMETIQMLVIEKLQMKQTLLESQQQIHAQTIQLQQLQTTNATLQQQQNQHHNNGTTAVHPSSLPPNAAHLLESQSSELSSLRSQLSSSVTSIQQLTESLNRVQIENTQLNKEKYGLEKELQKTKYELQETQRTLNTASNTQKQHEAENKREYSTAPAPIITVASWSPSTAASNTTIPASVSAASISTSPARVSLDHDTQPGVDSSSSMDSKVSTAASSSSPRTSTHSSTAHEGLHVQVSLPSTSISLSDSPGGASDAVLSPAFHEEEPPIHAAATSTAAADNNSGESSNTTVTPANAKRGGKNKQRQQ